MFDEDETTTMKLPFEGYIETSELIKNMDVAYEEIDIHHIAEFEQTAKPSEEKKEKEVISEIPSEKEVVSSKEEEVMEDQILMFDLPVNSSSESKSHAKEESEEMETITSQIEDIEVNDHVEVVPVTEFSDEGIKRYSLDDYQEMESHLSNAKPTKKNEAAEEEVVFETKTIAVPDTSEPESDETEDPMNTPISKLLRDRTEERKRKMKEFNYKFRNSASKIEDIEKQPAYKRMGIELDDAKDSKTDISRTSVNTDDDDINLRSNNSFLHDNVD